MALTALQIDTDKTEYSRLEPLRSTVKVRVLPTPATDLVGEVVVLSLIKKGVTIWSTELTFNGNYPKGQVQPIDLTNIKDALGVTHINRGIYTLTVTQGNVTASKRFQVAMITALEMRKSYCQGLYLVSGYQLTAKRQPVAVTGVTIIEVSKGSKAGVVALSFDCSAETLTWGGGTPTPIADEESAILIDCKGNWVVVEIDQFSLPAVNSAEGILLAEESLDDNYLRTEIEKATKEAEILLKVFLEPTRIGTDPYFSNPEDGQYFDYRAMPVMYQDRDFNMRGMGWQIHLPYHQLSSVSVVEGYIGNTQALTISEGALSINRKSGMLDVLPYNSQYIAFYTFFLTFNFWGNREFIADFWRYQGTAGIEENTPGDILKLVGMIAAQSILITAEQAYRAGTTAESNSKDGVSRSSTYNSKGVYDTTISEYKEWVKRMAPKLRNQYRGLPCVVM